VDQGLENQQAPIQIRLTVPPPRLRFGEFTESAGSGSLRRPQSSSYLDETRREAPRNSRSRDPPFGLGTASDPFPCPAACEASASPGGAVPVPILVLPRSGGTSIDVFSTRANAVVLKQTHPPSSAGMATRLQPLEAISPRERAVLVREHARRTVRVEELEAHGLTCGLVGRCACPGSC
jgi:hypothetical protein